MADTSATGYGALPLRVSVQELRLVLTASGLTPSLGDTHHVSVRECGHFVFREDGKGTYLVSADAESTEEMLRDTARVSDALSKNKIEHSFEVYDSEDRFVRKFSYPPAGDAA